MSDLLEQGEAWLEGQRRKHMAHTVTYHRGENFVDILATVGRTLFEQTDDYDIVHRLESRDFIIHAADLVLGEMVVLPEDGDFITEVQGSTIYTYDLLSWGGEPPWRYTGSTRTALRVHTKQVDKVVS